MTAPAATWPARPPRTARWPSWCRSRTRPPVRVQPGLDPGLAAALGVAGMAGWVALDYRGHLRPGETVLILGAGGTAGQLAVQAARLLGAGRVVGAAREKDLRQVDAAAPTRSSTSPTTRPSTLAWPAQRPAATT